MKQPLRITALFIFFISAYVQADIAVLVHGYHSTGNTWRAKGITSLLAANGWHDAGFYTPQGNYAPYTNPLSNNGKYLVTAELPSESPVEIQSDLLSQYLMDIMHKFPQQKIHIIAHSAGGIVARYSLVTLYQQNKVTNISQLITISTPHFGSVIAEVAKRASDTPMSIVAPLFGADEINRAEILYQQLGREEKNEFLYWLNRQPHPPMQYASIIRASGSFLDGDWLVPAASQNMALVPVIGSNALVFLSSGDHHLKYSDGFLLLNLLP